MSAGPVDGPVSGSGLIVEPVTTTILAEEDGPLLLPATGPPMTNDDVRELRLADQR